MRFGIALLVGVFIFGSIRTCVSQQLAVPSTSDSNRTQNDSSLRAVPEKVEVARKVSDSEIAARLQRIFAATEWFPDIEVRVDQGVVSIQGTARDQEVKDWATDLARRTEDVTAVVNKLTLSKPPLWDLQPAAEGLRELWRDTVAMLPFFVFGLAILIAALLAAQLASFISRRLLQSYISSSLLCAVLARTIGFSVIIFGVYIVLRVSGLTRLALTVIGGTGILGLVIGIAFRDITENFLASIVLSMARPYLVGDLVEIVGVLGYVQRLTTRCTMLITLDGNHVEIPNSTVYKNTIRNFSTNQNRREDFDIGIGYQVPIAEAQRIALEVLRRHPAVLDDPEPWSLVDRLEASTVVLRIYFWLDGKANSWLKVKSSVIRLVKRAYQEHGITMPDSAREIVFPSGVSVQIHRESLGPADDRGQDKIDPGRTEGIGADEPASTSAEGGLHSDASEIEKQAAQARQTTAENLLAEQNTLSSGNDSKKS